LLAVNIQFTRPFLWSSSQGISGVAVAVGGWRRQGRKTKSKLQKTASFIEVKPLNVYQSTHTYILLTALIFPKWSRGLLFRHKLQLLCWPRDIRSVTRSPHTSNNGC
jgi:hypothetical protein